MTTVTAIFGAAFGTINFFLAWFARRPSVYFAAKPNGADACFVNASNHPLVITGFGTFPADRVTVFGPGERGATLFIRGADSFPITVQPGEVGRMVVSFEDDIDEIGPFIIWFRWFNQSNWFPFSVSLLSRERIRILTKPKIAST